MYNVVTGVATGQSFQPPPPPAWASQSWAEGWYAGSVAAATWVTERRAAQSQCEGTAGASGNQPPSTEQPGSTETSGTPPSQTGPTG